MSNQKSKQRSVKPKFSDSEKKRFFKRFRFIEVQKTFFRAQGISASAGYRWKQEAVLRKRHAQSNPIFANLNSAKTLNHRIHNKF